MSPREIDALVAERIFDWQWWISTPKPEITPTPPWVQVGVRFLHDPVFTVGLGLQARAIGNEPIGTGLYHSEYPHYSTDPAASKQLRDEMRAKGWRFQMRDRSHSKRVFACFDKPQENKYIESLGDTEEMAIALAALSAVGKPVTE